MLKIVDESFKKKFQEIKSLFLRGLATKLKTKRLSFVSGKFCTCYKFPSDFAIIQSTSWT